MAAILPLMVLAALAGCQAAADDPDPIGSPYAAAFSVLRDDATDDPFITQAIADDHITDDELLELHERLATCVRAAGFEVIVELDQVTYGDTSEVGEERLDEVIDACEPHLAEFETLHTDPRINPDNLDFNQLVVDCLVSNGIVDPGLTVEEYLSTEDLSTLWSAEHDEEADACLFDPLAGS